MHTNSRLINGADKMRAMTATKQKSDHAKVRWANQVFKTADGRLLVRGVDVPASGWASVTSREGGKSVTTASGRPMSIVPSAINNKREAFATAKRAGLASQVKPAGKSDYKAAVGDTAKPAATSKVASIHKKK